MLGALASKWNTYLSNHRDNQLLARLDPATFLALEPDLQIAHLSPGDVITSANASVEKVYFPHGGLISCFVKFDNGEIVETGMIGRDGQCGAGATIECQIPCNYAVAELAGTASVVDAARFRKLASSVPQLRHETMAYEFFLLAQAQQTAACNAAHNVSERVCKWLLRMQALVGNEISVTQLSLAQMIGVRRSTVAGVAVDLRDAGMISYTRGRLKIEDLAQMQAAACVCGKRLNAQYSRAFPPNVGCISNDAQHSVREREKL